MTQQNETEQEAAGFEQPGQSTEPGAPGPVYPSPYLNGGDGLPQAYLAPPQPGQPRYGAQPRTPGNRPFGGPQRYSQPPAARPAGGLVAASRRDPALATAWHRLAASTIDWFIILTVSVIAFWSPLSQIWREFEAIASRYPYPTSPAAQAAINAISRDPSNERALAYWFLGLFGIALVYFWVQHAAWGATVGKRALGVRVVRAADRAKIGVRQAGIRTVALLVGPALLMLPAYLIGGAIVTAINITGGVLWAADGGLPLLDSQAQSLHDKLAGTVVVRQRWLDQRSRGSQSW